MPSHLQDFARHEIARTGPTTAGALWVMFVERLGNMVPGNDQAAQISAIEAELRKDKTFVCTEVKGARHGLVFSLKA